MRLGANLEEVKPDGRTWPFADLCRQRGPYGTFNTPYDGAAKLDATGEPVGDFGFYVVEGSDDNPVPVPAGDYQLSFDGQAANVTASATIVNPTRDPATGRNTAIVRVPDGGPLNLWLRFGGVTQPIRNVRLLLPGHAESDTYNRALVALLRNFACVRVMDFARTNGHPVAEWKDRTQPNGWQAGPAGAAWEHAVGLANAAGVDLWLNVPHQASDDYVRQLAALVKSKLNPDRYVYVAHSNEVWNYQFPQCGWNRDRAAAEQKAGQFDYNYGSPNDNNPEYWRMRRHARRTVEIGQAFRQAFGATSSMVRPVLEHQIMWYDQLGDMINYLRAKNPTVSLSGSMLYGAAVGSYLGPSDPAPVTDPGATTASLTAACRAALPGIDRENQRVLAVCKKYGLANCAYELGTDLGQQNVAVKAKVAAQDTPEMGGVVASLLAESDKGLDGVANYYLLAGTYGRDGYWGLTDRFLGPTPKLDAALAFAKAHPAPPVAIPPSPGTPNGSSRTVVSITTTLKDGRGTIAVAYSDGNGETITR